MSTALSVDDLQLGKRGDRLSSLSISIDDGVFFGLVGMNGAGKTSLIQTILDFCRPESGTITTNGYSHHLPASRKQLAYLPERFTPPSRLTAEKFLRRMAALYGSEFQRDTTLELFDQLALERSSFTKPLKQFSKGMAQKIGLIALLMSNRDFLILDEPMSGLDPYSRALMKNLLLRRREHRQQPHTLLLSSHMLSDVEILCDQIAILHQGVLQFTGSPEECLLYYQADTLEQAYVNCIDTL